VGDVVLERVEIGVLRGDLDAAFPTPRAKIIVRAGIVEDASVNREVIVVEAFVQRSGGGAGPDVVFTLGEIGAGFAIAAQAETHADRFRIGCSHAETRVAL